MSRTELGSVIVGNTSVIQMLDLDNDSTHFLINGVEKAVVDHSGYTSINGEQVGKFSLRDNRWAFFAHDESDAFMWSRPNTAFKLPEFELEVIPKLLGLESKQ